MIGPYGDISWQDNSDIVYYASDGSKFLDLTGWNNDYSYPHGGIALNQTITTIPGQQYLLSFDVGSSRYYNWGNVPQVTVTINGNPSTFIFNSNALLPDTTGFRNSWEHTAFTFIASGEALDLSFQGTTPNPILTIFLDNVSLVAVPEPSTFIAGVLELLLPFGACILWSLRKNRTA